MKYVLKHGNMFYIKVCPYCNCEFLYQHIDISLESKNNMYIPMINCPECHNVLEADEIPYNEVKNYINNLIDG